ncbi:autophagy-related protein 13a-like [Iris pallida]|uniref:Autophagy-related protein 13a-like n=1 Tax=Iris pallida TaxID=29817 RepID=A0AAX6GT29_IRIPA|nr:autophagy-related protein 13a-like [Iris pallida]
MADQGRTEQIISQLQAKTLYVVLSSRIPAISRLSEHHPDPSTRTRRRDRWFNLALGELPPALLENPGFFFPHGAMDPMVIDILLLSSAMDQKVHVVERWSATCDPPPPPNSAADGSLYRKTYKKSIVLLRSLYSVLRLLPLFRIFRTLCSSSHSYNFDISYRVSSFSEPFSRQEEKELKTYSFTPVETQFGYLFLSVTYRPDLSGFNLVASSLAPPPMIITDYVGSPAAEPMRPFPPSPAAAYRNPGPISYPSRGQNSSGLPSFQRPHSWNAMPMEHHPLSEQNSLPIDAYRNCTSGQRTAAVSHKKGSFSFDEFRLSPPFSASPTPSPPTYSSGSSLQSRLRSETAPVSIPMGLGLPGKGQAYRTPNHSDPTRSFLPPPSPRSTKMDHSSQESPSSEGRSFRKSEGLKVADFYSNLHLYAAQKGLKDGRDDSGRFSGGFSSSGSPRFGFSRSSSRLSMQDDLDDCDFNCPFAVDDVDTSESQTRNLDGKEVPESSQAYTSSRKSQDAAVGALVHMLKTAPPLRQDHSYSCQSSRSEVNCEVGNSSLFKLRKSSDALEELRSYRKIKDILLSQSRTELLNSVKRTTE